MNFFLITAGEIVEIKNYFGIFLNFLMILKKIIFNILWPHCIYTQKKKKQKKCEKCFPSSHHDSKWKMFSRIFFYVFSLRICEKLYEREEKFHLTNEVMKNLKSSTGIDLGREMAWKLIGVLLLSKCLKTLNFHPLKFQREFHLYNKHICIPPLVTSLAT